MAKNRERNPELDAALLDVIIPDAAYTYTSVYNRYANSTFGIHHAKEDLRYSQDYGYDYGQMLADLGDDVHPVRHMFHTQRNVASHLLSAQVWNGSARFSVEDIRAIRLAAITHDMGEGRHDIIAKKVGPPVGDVFYSDKTDAHRAQERKIRQFLYGELFPDMPAELFDAAEAVIDTEDTLQGLAFDTIERVGYYQTAIHAGKIALKLAGESSTKSPRFASLARLAVNVSGMHQEILDKRGNTFPYARATLRRNNDAYTSIQVKLPDIIDQTTQNT